MPVRISESGVLRKVRGKKEMSSRLGRYVKEFGIPLLIDSLHGQFIGYAHVIGIDFKALNVALHD
jgi:hypothetical protein